MPDSTIPTAAGSFTVTAELRAGLYAKYPGVDVHKELALMHLWLAKNPARVRTLTKPIRFVEVWLARTRDSTGPAGHVRRSQASIEGQGGNALGNGAGRARGSRQAGSIPAPSTLNAAPADPPAESLCQASVPVGAASFRSNGPAKPIGDVIRSLRLIVGKRQ